MHILHCKYLTNEGYVISFDYLLFCLELGCKPLALTPWTSPLNFIDCLESIGDPAVFILRSSRLKDKVAERVYAQWIKLCLCSITF